MNIAAMSLADLAGLISGFVLTLLIFSYILGDNPLFRLVLHLFIGVSAGTVSALVLRNVVIPRLIWPFLSGNSGEMLLALTPLVLSLLLLAKIWPKISRVGNPAMAYLVGVGAAAAIGGAVLGTLFPQTWATINAFEAPRAFDSGSGTWLLLLNNGVMLLGTLSTLAFFHFTGKRVAGEAAKRSVWIESLAMIGQIFLAMTLGLIFTGVLSASLAALVERLYFLVNFLRTLLLPMTAG